MIRIAAVLLMILAIGAAQSGTTFHAETQLVQVSVLVHEKNRPVANLTKDDFILTDRGTPRIMSVFAAASHHAEPAAGPLPPNTFSNRPHTAADMPSGVTVILLDGMNTLNFAIPVWDFVDTMRTDTLALAFAREQVVKFAKAIQPGDRVAIYSLGRNLRVLCDFTNDSAQLQKILAGYRGEPAVSGDDAEPLRSNVPEDTGDFKAKIDGGNQRMAGNINASRAGATIDALRSIASHVAGIPGRKNLIWLTSDIPLPAATVARIVSRSNITVYPVDARGLASQLNRQYDSLMAVSQMPMRQVAEETGGHAYLNNNDLSGAIRQAIDDAAVTYTLGFYVDSSSLDGKFHEIKVRVKNPGADVRYPKGYYALLDLSSEKRGESNVDRTVLSPLESAEVHLLARVERIGPPPSLSVSGSVDLRNIDLKPEGTRMTGSVEVYLIQQDASGALLDKVREKLVLRLDQREYAAYLKSGAFFRKVVAAKPNVATLRVVAGDPRTAKMGSLIIPISQIR